MVPDATKKSGKTRKVKKPKTTAAVHITKKKVDKRDICYWYAVSHTVLAVYKLIIVSGAHNCDGIMFNRHPE